MAFRNSIELLPIDRDSRVQLYIYDLIHVLTKTEYYEKTVDDNRGKLAGKSRNITVFVSNSLCNNDIRLIVLFTKRDMDVFCVLV